MMEDLTLNAADKEVAALHGPAAEYRAVADTRTPSVDFMFDADLETQRKYYALLKVMPQSMKFEISMRLSQFARESMLSGLRRKFPEFTEKQVRREYLRHIMTPTEFVVVYPDRQNLTESLAERHLEGIL